MSLTLPPFPHPARRFGCLATLVVLLLCAAALPATAQATLAVSVDMAPLEGVELTPANAFAYRILNGSGAPMEVRVKGTLHFRNTPMRLYYSADLKLEPGVNALSREQAGNPVWGASDEALRSLFVTYGRLPQGTYEYCVEVTLKPKVSEQGAPEPVDGCTYHTVEDLFAINLIDPEDKAQLYERYPVFSWAVNYPFASELTYRIRVAEQKPGQNPYNAIARNNPVWQDAGVLATTATYPLAGRPLEIGQPYVWTVDAYYHGLLLGGAETWQFTLIEDSLLAAIPRESYHIDIRQEKRTAGIYAVGMVKIKYNLDYARSGLLNLMLRSERGTLMKLPLSAVSIKEGDNRFEVDLKTVPGIKHLGRYILTVRDGDDYVFELPVRYVNPDLLP